MHLQAPPPKDPAKVAPRMWLRPKSASLEASVAFVFWTLVRVTVLIYAFRYAMGADLDVAPWRVFGLP
jgi:hypothetical protein